MMRELKSLIRSAVVIFLLFVVGVVRPSDIGRMPIGEMVRASEIVVIATTLSVHSVSDDDEYAILSVDRVVRGTRVPGTIRLTTKSIVAGANLPCCTVGTRLLVFATNDYSNRYSATNDYHGVFVLDGRRVLYWPELKDDTWGDIDAVLHEIALGAKWAEEHPLQSNGSRATP